MKRIATVSVGVPAYNEERNISQLLNSILRQKQATYVLEKIYVVCDGCTDNTAMVVSKLARKHAEIELIERNKRSGKANALNLIYSRNKSNFLLTIDADLAFEKKDDLELMVKALIDAPNTTLVGPRHIPVPQKNIWGTFAYYSYKSFEDAFLRWNSGNNFYGVMSANLIRSSLTKSFRFPKGTVSDQCYLYAKATNDNPSGFLLVKTAHVLFQPVSTFRDWRLLGVRSTSGDKKDLAKHFGKAILKRIAIPKWLLYTSLLKWTFVHPIPMLGSIAMNLFIRLFPYKKMSLEHGIWETTMSAKVAIHFRT